ncbi:unnamed protein product [Protopolystoma xenopodis]|uniref:Uncharacterized protein n=1 Tax=Protopolystoma xenopodis TaxID=117903 RepID=A0A3S5A5V4_9PLAT|nr:unnamed protein product [Protopolystoma xenopodis]
MVRLILVLAPVMCILSGIGVSGILKTFIRNLNCNSSSGLIDSSLPSSTNTNGTSTSGNVYGFGRNAVPLASGSGKHAFGGGASFTSKSGKISDPIKWD